MGGYDQKGPEMAEDIRGFCEERLVNAIGGCCGSGPEHIAAIADMAHEYPPRLCHGVDPLMRLSGLEPLNYQPDSGNMRSTFLKIGERCNVAGSSIYKKAIVDGDYDKALAIAAKQVRHVHAVTVYTGRFVADSACLYRLKAAQASSNAI